MDEVVKSGEGDKEAAKDKKEDVMEDMEEDVGHNYIRDGFVPISEIYGFLINEQKKKIMIYTTHGETVELSGCIYFNLIK